MRADVQRLFEFRAVEGGLALGALLEHALGLDAALVRRDVFDPLILSAEPGHVCGQWSVVGAQ
jgi:hypothetical protein